MDLILTIVNIVLAIGAVSAIVMYVLPKLQQISAATKEISELLDALTQALTDGKLDAEELKNIKKEGDDVVAAIKAVLKKKK